MITNSLILLHQEVRSIPPLLNMSRPVAALIKWSRSDILWFLRAPRKRPCNSTWVSELSLSWCSLLGCSHSEPSHPALRSAVHMGRPRVCVPLNSSSWAQPLHHPSPCIRHVSEKFPKNSSPHPFEPPLSHVHFPSWGPRLYAAETNHLHLYIWNFWFTIVILHYYVWGYFVLLQ